MNRILVILMMLYFPLVFSQTKEEKLRVKENQQLLAEAQESMEAGNFSKAEANYRKVIASDSKNTEAKFNLGNAYYSKEKNREAGRRYVEAAEVATSKSEKHKIYHNLGNVLMNEKDYKGAVEAYKNALRNDPTDDETRYNLALAKKMLEEHGDQGGGDDDDEQEDEKEEGDSQEDENQGDQGQDNEDKGDEGEDEPEQNADEKNDEGEPKEQESQGEPQPAEGKLSPQQIQSLLEAMNNEEKKVQDKINAEKQKGVKVKPEKDW